MLCYAWTWAVPPTLTCLFPYNPNDSFCTDMYWKFFCISISNPKNTDTVLSPAKYTVGRSCHLSLYSNNFCGNLSYLYRLGHCIDCWSHPMKPWGKSSCRPAASIDIVEGLRKLVPRIAREYVDIPHTRLINCNTLVTTIWLGLLPHKLFSAETTSGRQTRSMS